MVDSDALYKKCLLRVVYVCISQTVGHRHFENMIMGLSEDSKAI
jgi:hypothetical protein